MKNIILFVLSLSLFACEKYEQPSLLTLSGTYRIDSIKISTPNISTNITGLDTFVNNDGIPSEDTIWTPLGPIDTILVGKTVWEINYLYVRMLPTFIPDNPTIWKENFPYSEINYFSYVSIQFPYRNNNNTTSIMILQVIEDKLESIVFRYSKNSNSHIDYYLTKS